MPSGEITLGLLVLVWLHHLRKGHTRIAMTMTNQQDPDMLDEYDFSKGIRGKYAQRYSEGSNIVKLDDDVAEIFPDEKSVNDALRALANIIRSHQYLA